MMKVLSSVCLILLFALCDRIAGDDSHRGSQKDLLCGVRCLYSGLVALDLKPGDYSEFMQRCGDADTRGYSLGRLEEIARSHGASTLAVNTTLDHLAMREQPFVCIAHVDENHYVNIGDVDANQVWVIDPPRDGMISTAVFAKRWDGYALLLSRTPLEPEESLRRPWPWKWMMAGGAAAFGLSLWGFLWKRKRT